MYEASWYVWAVEGVAVIGIPAAAARAVRAGAIRAGDPAGALASAPAALTVGWLALSGWLAASGQLTGSAPWLVVVFAGVLGTAVLLGRTASGRRAVEAASPSSLVLPHTFRLAGVVFLILMLQGHLPAVFALPAGLGDIAVGLAAPLVARRLSANSLDPVGLRFNVLGLLDLGVALVIGFFAGLGPIHLISGGPSTAVLATLPLALVPTVTVPTAVALHLASLARRRTEIRRGASSPIAVGAESH